VHPERHLPRDAREREPQPPLPEHDAERTAQHREQHALGEELADDAPPGRAHGEAHAQLADARVRAREQQVRDVRAGDQQHERDREPEQQEHRPGLADQGLADQHRAEHLVAVGVDIVLGDRGGDLRQLRTALCERCARRQPPAIFR
jgi:hypothetical protein